jgi:hypothetical protein
MLEQLIVDHTGRPLPGPHPVGWVLRHTPGAVLIRLLSTDAGRTARALLEEEILDVALSRDYPPVIRLTASAGVSGAGARQAGSASRWVALGACH